MCKSAYLGKSAHNPVDIDKSVSPDIDEVLSHIIHDSFYSVQKYITNSMDKTDAEVEEFMEVVVLRAHILRALQECGNMSLADLNHTLDDSRRSLDRWLDELAAHDLILDDDGMYKLTFLGDVTTDLYRDHCETYATLTDAQELLARLPTGTDIGCALMDGVEVEIEPPEAPESAWHPVDQAVHAGDSVVGIAPRVTPSYVDTFYREIVEHGMDVELLLPPKVYSSIVRSYEREWQSAIVAENAWFGSVKEVPEFGMLIIDESEVWVGVYRGDGGGALVGTLYNESAEAVAWALELYGRYRDDANDVLALD
jgi:predicted transcriptional regulator